MQSQNSNIAIRVSPLFSPSCDINPPSSGVRLFCASIVPQRRFLVPSTFVRFRSNLKMFSRGAAAWLGKCGVEVRTTPDAARHWDWPNALGRVRAYALPVSKMSACEIAPAPTSPLTTMHREAHLCRSPAITPHIRGYRGYGSRLISSNWRIGIARRPLACRRRWRPRSRRHRQTIRPASLRAIGDLRKLSRSPLRSGHHHIDLPAAAAGTDQPLAPIEHGRFGAVPGSHLGGVGLDLMLAFLAPDDQPDLGRGGDAERHRRATIRFHGCAIERLRCWLFVR